MENMGEAEGTSTYRLGGGEKGEWTPAEAADWFAKQYLPDLSEVSVRFPEEWLYSGCSIQTPDLPPDQLAKQMYETVEVEEKDKVGSFMGNVTGDNAEHEMYKYLTGIPKTSRTALFVNYNVSMFQRFRGKPHQNQEFDIVLVFGELRKWLTIEVKAGQKGGKGWADQLKEGKIFYNEVLAATGTDTKDWEYIPVGAFPNAQNWKQVNGVPNFLKQNPNGLVITKHEMSRSLDDLLPNGPKYEIDETYLTLVKWLMASAHCSKLGASLSLTPSDPVKETKRKLVGSNTSDLGVGVSEDPGPSSSTVSQYSSLKGKPVGSQESILFWNKDQAQFLFQDNPRCIIKGDYGSGKTLVLFAKLKSLVEKGLKVVFISCLLPYADVPPIYESIMRKKLKELGDNIRFYSAMGICSEMGVILGYTDREKSFYSVLAKFIQNLPEEFNTLLIDEFGDDLFPKMEEMLGVTGSLAGSEGKQLIISLHPSIPHSNIDVSKLKDQGYKISELKYIMRNTASIWKYDQSVSCSESDSRTSTVLGLQPVYIVGSEDKDFYSRTVEAVCEKSRKFVCLMPDSSGYDYRFKAELKRRGIKIFVYLIVGDEKNLDKFLESQEGCLITIDEHARGTECTTLLVFKREDMSSKILRGTTHLVVADLDPANNPVSVEEPEPGYILIKGNNYDPIVYSSLVDKMLEKNIERYIYILDLIAIKGLFLDELERRGLPTPVQIPSARYSVEDIKTHLQENISGGILYDRGGIELERGGLPPPVKIPRAMYSVEDIKTHLQENISGGILYDRYDIEHNGLEWIGANSKIPIIYLGDMILEEDVERIRKGNPTLFIYVKVK